MRQRRFMRPMISAVITDAADAEKLSATFASLAVAASDGFVREVIVAGASGAAGSATAEAGASAAADRAAACASARQPWLLVLVAGTRLEIGWEQAAWRHVTDHPDDAGWFRLSLKGGLGARLREMQAGIAGRLGQPGPEQGLLTPKAGAARKRPIAARILG